MRLSGADIEKLLQEKGTSSDVARQLRAAKAAMKQATNHPVVSRARSAVESKGEATARVALTHAFGDWFEGGELVSELMPFARRRYRADFALPRYRIYVEIDGWAHHGEHLQDHHDDRERGLYFSQYDWLPFRVSHKQATQTPFMLVDAITKVLARRSPIDRQEILIERVNNPSSTWTRFAAGHHDA